MNTDLKQFQSTLLNFRKAFTIIIIINLIFLIERSIFDFMGFMYGMIVADICYLLFLIIGIFGAFQYRVNYVAASTILSLVWIAWNLFVVCNYLNVGFLDKYDPIVLNMNTNMKSWWYTSSIGCTEHIEARMEKYKYQEGFKNIAASTSQIRSASTLNTTSSFSTRRTPKNVVLENFIKNNCFLPFYTIEIIHSGVLIFLGILCVIFGLLLANAFNEDDDAFDYIGGFESAGTSNENEKNLNYSNNMIQQHQGVPILPRNAQIRLEPMYVSNQNNGN